MVVIQVLGGNWVSQGDLLMPYLFLFIGVGTERFNTFRSMIWWYLRLWNVSHREHYYFCNYNTCIILPDLVSLKSMTEYKFLLSMFQLPTFGALLSALSYCLNIACKIHVCNKLLWLAHWVICVKCSILFLKRSINIRIYLHALLVL